MENQQPQPNKETPYFEETKLQIEQKFWNNKDAFIQGTINLVDRYLKEQKGLNDEYQALLKHFGNKEEPKKEETKEEKKDEK